MSLSGPARRLTVIVGECDVWNHESEDLLVAVAVVDTVERIEEFLPQLDELVTAGLVLLDDVHVHRYVGRAAR
jgi:PII-like signaling protein